MIVSCFLRPFLREVRMLPYLMICVSVVFEVFGDTMMKVSDGFRRKLPIVGVVVGYAVSFWMMSIFKVRIVRMMPIKQGII